MSLCRRYFFLAKGVTWTKKRKETKKEQKENRLKVEMELQAGIIEPTGAVLTRVKEESLRIHQAISNSVLETRNGFEITISPTEKDWVDMMNGGSKSPSEDSWIFFNHVNITETVSVKLWRRPTFLGTIVNSHLNSLELPLNRRINIDTHRTWQKNLTAISVNNKI